MENAATVSLKKERKKRENNIENIENIIKTFLNLSWTDFLTNLGLLKRTISLEFARMSRLKRIEFAAPLWKGF